MLRNLDQHQLNWLSVLVPLYERLLVLRAHTVGTETLVVVDGLEPPTARQSSAYERYKLSALPLSYTTLYNQYTICWYRSQHKKRNRRIELLASVWKTEVLPLYEFRKMARANLSTHTERLISYRTPEQHDRITTTKQVYLDLSLQSRVGTRLRLSPSSMKGLAG